MNVCIGWVPAVEHGGPQDNREQWVARGSYPRDSAASPYPFESVSVGGMFEKPPREFAEYITRD